MASPRRYELTFELSGEVDPRIIRSVRDLSHDLDTMQGELDRLRRTRPIPDDVPDSFRELSERAREFGDVFQTALDFTGAKAIIDSVTGAFATMISDVGDLESSLFKMQAATGASVLEMKDLDGSLRSLYESNYGEGFGDIADSMVGVKNATGLTGDSLKDATEAALTLRDVFGYEVNESMRTVGVMMKNMGLTADQAFNLIAQGSQKGLNRADDFLDTINEYSVQFKDAGYNAQEMLSIIESGMAKGAFNTDKVADALKEFRIRILSGDKAVTESMAYLFAPDNIEEFLKTLKKGGSATKEYQELVKRTSKDTAASLLKDLNNKSATKSASAWQTITEIMSDSQKIFNGLSDGSIKARDALQMVNDKLLTIDDLQMRNAYSVALFGTQYEDMGAGITQALTDVNGAFDQNLNTMEEIKALNLESFTKQLQGLGRELMTEIVIPIGEDLLPQLHALVDFASENKDVIKFLALATPAAMVGKNVVVLAKGIGSIKNTLIEAAGAGGMLSKSLALMKSPAGIAVGAIGLVTAGVIAYQQHQEAARQSLINMGDELKTAFDDYNAMDEQRDNLSGLIREYDRLKTKIADTKTPAEELTEAQRKLADIEQQIINQSDGYITAQDAKTGALREQAGAQLELLDNMTRLSYQDAKMVVLDKKANIPKLTEEYRDLQQQMQELTVARDRSSKVLEEMLEIQEKYNDIMQGTSGEERTQQLQNLSQEVSKLMGVDFSDWSMFPALIGGVQTGMNQVKEDLKTTQDELRNTEASYQEYYDANLRLVEAQYLNGESLDEMIAKYGELSVEQQTVVDAAIEKMGQFHKTLNDIPVEKRVDINVAWRETGRNPMLAASQYFNPTYETKGKQMPVIPLPTVSFGGINGYAQGDRITSPEIAAIGEGGDTEYVIPINNSPRSRGLYAAAGKELGIDQGGTFAPVFSPQITVQGNADERVIREVVRDSQREFERNMAEWQRKNGRRNLA